LCEQKAAEYCRQHRSKIAEDQRRHHNGSPVPVGDRKIAKTSTGAETRATGLLQVQTVIRHP